MPVLLLAVPYDVLVKADGAPQLEIYSISNLGRQAGNEGRLQLWVDGHLGAPLTDVTERAKFPCFGPLFGLLLGQRESGGPRRGGRGQSGGSWWAKERGKEERAYR